MVYNPLPQRVKEEPRQVSGGVFRGVGSGLLSVLVEGSLIGAKPLCVLKESDFTED